MPREFGEVRGLAFKPFGGGCFEFFDGVGHCGGSGKTVEDVNVVLDRIHEDDGTSESFADLAEVGMEGGADVVGEEGVAVRG